MEGPAQQWTVMSDALPPGDNSWRSILAYLVITAIALSAEYIRRIMPPPRKRRKWDDDDDEHRFAEDEAAYEDSKRHEEDEEG